MSRRRGVQAGSSLCSNDRLFVRLPPEVTPVARYAILTAFTVVAYKKNLGVDLRGDVVEISGGNAFDAVKEGLGLRQPLNTPNDFCREFYENIRFENYEIRLGVGAQGWKGMRPKQIVRDMSVYFYSRAPWLFNERREGAGAQVRPVGGHLNIASFGGFFAWVLGRVDERRLGDSRYLVLLSGLGVNTKLNRVFVEELYSIDKDSNGRPIIRLNMPQIPYSNEVAPSRLLLTWLMLYLVRWGLEKSSVSELRDIPSLAVVNVSDYPLIYFITGDEAANAGRALASVASEVGVGGRSDDERARRLADVLMFMIRRARACPGVMSRALSVAEEAMAGRIDYDLYYGVTRDLRVCV